VELSWGLTLPLSFCNPKITLKLIAKKAQKLDTQVVNGIPGNFYFVMGFDEYF